MAKFEKVTKLFNTLNEEKIHIKSPMIQYDTDKGKIKVPVIELPVPVNVSSDYLEIAVQYYVYDYSLKIFEYELSKAEIENYNEYDEDSCTRHESKIDRLQQSIKEFTKQSEELEKIFTKFSEVKASLADNPLAGIDDLKEMIERDTFAKMYTIINFPKLSKIPVHYADNKGQPKVKIIDNKVCDWIYAISSNERIFYLNKKLEKILDDTVTIKKADKQEVYKLYFNQIEQMIDSTNPFYTNMNLHKMPMKYFVFYMQNTRNSYKKNFKLLSEYELICNFFAVVCGYLKGFPLVDYEFKAEKVEKETEQTGIFNILHLLENAENTASPKVTPEENK